MIIICWYCTEREHTAQHPDKYSHNTINIAAKSLNGQSVIGKLGENSLFSTDLCENISLKVVIKPCLKTANVRSTVLLALFPFFFFFFFFFKQKQFGYPECSVPPPRALINPGHRSLQTAGQLAGILDMGAELQGLTHKATAY